MQAESGGAKPRLVQVGLEGLGPRSGPPFSQAVQGPAGDVCVALPVC